MNDVAAGGRDGEDLRMEAPVYAVPMRRNDDKDTVLVENDLYGSASDATAAHYEDAYPVATHQQNDESAEDVDGSNVVENELYGQM